MMTREQHYVTFHSPGTFFAETTTRKVDAWSPQIAVKMAEGIVERYGATPYGFTFETRLEHEPVSDGRGGALRVEPKTLATSGMHFIGGRIETYYDVVARADPREEVLRSNASSPDMCVVCITERGYRSTNVFAPNSVTVGPTTGEIIARGDDPKYVEIRSRRRADLKAELSVYRR